MKSSIQFLGGAGTVTGSKFLLRIEDKKILVDCGLFQGLKNLRLRNWEPLPVRPHEIDAVLLTHAHLDHSGYLPLLVRNGFSGPIYSSPPTRDLSRVILSDSGKIQEEDAERANQGGYSKHSPALPLYTVRDAHNAVGRFSCVSSPEWFSVSDRIEARFTNSGHILGSSLIEIKTPDLTIAFSGDLGRSDPLVLNPPCSIKSADYLVIESTYGDRVHSPLSPLKTLAKIVNDTYARKGQLIIPAFAVGRTQDILFLLSALRAQSQIPEIPIFLDSPMGINATEIFSDYPDWHRLSHDEITQLCSLVTLVKSQQQSEEVLRRKDSAIVIAGSGMLTGGRVLTHLVHRLPDERNTVLLVGYQPPSTRGSLLLAGASELKIYGQYIPVRASIEEISTLSAHADQKEMLKWLKMFNHAPKNTFIVHGEPQASEALRLKMKDELGWNVSVPSAQEVFEL
jgi:metallo-beta-lactamase family protein